MRLPKNCFSMNHIYHYTVHTHAHTHTQHCVFHLIIKNNITNTQKWLMIRTFQTVKAIIMKHSKIKLWSFSSTFVINIVSSSLLVFSTCALHFWTGLKTLYWFQKNCTHSYTSEVSFPKELFEDGLVARPRQAGVAPQGGVLIGVLLPSGQGQQRGVRAPAHGRTVWWLVPNHQSHAVVGASFRASECGRMGHDGFDLLEGCWETKRWQH